MRSGLTAAAHPSILFSRCILRSWQNKELQAALGFPLHKGGVFIPCQVSHSPGGSSDLLLPQSPSSGHQNPAAMRRHRGVVAQFYQNKRLCHIFLRLPLLPLPTRFIRLGDWKEEGKECRRFLGFHRSEPLVPGPGQVGSGPAFLLQVSSGHARTALQRVEEEGSRLESSMFGALLQSSTRG